ncbi:cation diffusion facilitator CzcD-associated flavoprotein CzcO [Allocatelliglobosispora scoriae]|uniref:Cation diffusion facilitator CzcD-associated flavoprotein CzcO n=1 Tax=Allocatelliglobosispora scoriae TaxID=643052 RepID=A0A841BP60_9ACTN|nr:NAD(P)-binding domain-containing protein [Allocatelliglobosispora scoriae]MBB5869455.1 cation diffusion facilitator CzcD-associated flavoprotein CzcO [Allocatelliglobosispora scoriae]
MSYDLDAPGVTLWRDGFPVYDRGETVCVIGAGPSGLTAIKNLKEAGFGVDCYERETSVGGAWNWRHDRSPVYGSTHLISSKPFTQFPDFPMPDSWPDYPHHSQVLTYLERYSEHFDLKPHIWFGTEVVKVEPAEGGHWDVTTRSTSKYGGAERIHRYTGVVIANGHNWSPKMPAYEGLEDYRGSVIHASAYKDAAQLRGKKVLVIGGGNTGCDIAVEAAQQAARCWHSTRRGYWYAPKYALGRPTDQVNAGLQRLPLKLRQWVAQRTLKLTVGDVARFGLPAPDHKVYQSHPIVNSQLLYFIGHGGITPTGEVARFHRNSVQLKDGQEIEPDLVILATGYTPTFGFIEPELLGTDAQGKPNLYLHAFPRRHPTLAVAGLLQPDSGVLPLVHWQMVVFAQYLRQQQAAPAKAALVGRRVESFAGRAWTATRTTDSTRHWFEVSHMLYLRELQAVLNDLEGTR